MTDRVCIIGAGVIGRGWATSFLVHGWQVSLFDAQECVAEAALREVNAARLRLAQEGLVRDERHRDGGVGAAASLRDAVDGAELIIEAVSENLARKRDVLAEIEAVVAPGAIILSSTSALLPTLLAAEMRNPERFAVAHPFNPSYLIPVVELAPGERTSAATMDLARQRLGAIGKRVVTLNREIEGFVGNRLQAALINEAMNLLHLGVASAADIDACVSQCLGLRWAFYGPFATMDMNADGGIGEYARKFGDSYVKLGRELGVDQPWPQGALEVVAEEFGRDGDRARRVDQRDRALSNLVKLKRTLGESNPR